MSVPSMPRRAPAPRRSDSPSSGVSRSPSREVHVADRRTRKAVLRPGARTRFAHLLRAPLDERFGLASGPRVAPSEAGRKPGASAPESEPPTLAGHPSTRPGAASDAIPEPEPRLRAVVAEAADSEGRGPLAAFHPAPGVLVPPTSAPPPPAPSGSPSEAHAQAAALAGQLVRSMRVGRVGKDRHRVDMRLGKAAREGIDVRLEHERGRIRAVLRAEAHAEPDAQRIAEQLTIELERRGVELEEVDVEIA